MKISLFALIAGTVAAGSLAAQDQYEVFEKVSMPAPWTLKAEGEVDAEQSFKLRIHLKNRNIESFHQKVYDVSTPDHPDYGRHLSRLDLRNHLAPSDKSYELVLEWLESQGLAEKSTVEDDWIIVDGTVGDAEKLLETEYSLYKNAETGKVTVRTLGYSLRKHNLFFNLYSMSMDLFQWQMMLILCSFSQGIACPYRHHCSDYQIPDNGASHFNYCERFSSASSPILSELGI
jgi:hypothetical protein